MKHSFATFAIAALLGSGVAAADPAPIVYAGRAAPAPAAYDASALAGGDERSYGYGAAPRQERAAAVIDIRRSAAVSEQAPAPSSAPAAQAGERPAWLEQERVGPPYEANGRLYVPTPEPGYAQTGVASWYGPQFHGQRAANGEIFDQEGLTAAHPTLPLNSLVQVTNLANGREVIVRITDRGPFVGERLIDMSHGAAAALDFVAQGQAQVHVRYLGPAPRRYASEQGLAQAPGPVSLRPSAPSPAASVQAVAQGGYFVQVGAFSDRANAEGVREAVAAAGPAIVDTRATAGGELFRVRVGPLASSADAENTRRTLAAIGYDQAVVTTR